MSRKFEKYSDCQKFEGYSKGQHKIDDIIVETETLKEGEKFIDVDGKNLNSTVNLVQLKQINDIVQDLANKCNLLVQSANEQLEYTNPNQSYMGNDTYYSNIVNENMKHNLK
jgi:hypothetical protein